MNLSRLAPIDADTILPIADARAHLRIVTETHDARITRARLSAIDWAERYTGLAFLEASFLWTVDAFQTRIDLPRGPVTSVDAIEYRGSDGDDVSLEAADWYLARSRVSAAYGTSWPTGDHVRITFTAGHADVASIPPMLMAGMIVAMAAMFENAESPDLSGAERCLDMVRGAFL